MTQRFIAQAGRKGLLSPPDQITSRLFTNLTAAGMVFVLAIAITFAVRQPHTKASEPAVGEQPAIRAAKQVLQPTISASSHYASPRTPAPQPTASEQAKVERPYKLKIAHAGLDQNASLPPQPTSSLHAKFTSTGIRHTLCCELPTMTPVDVAQATSWSAPAHLPKLGQSWPLEPTAPHVFRYEASLVPFDFQLRYAAELPSLTFKPDLMRLRFVPRFQ